MHLERRSPTSKDVCYTDQIAALRASVFGRQPTLGVCWGEPPDSNLVLDILCDHARNDLLGLGGKGIKNPNPRIQILHIIYENPLPCALSASGASRFMRSLAQRPFKHNLCGVHSDLYPKLVAELLGQRHGIAPAHLEDEDGTTLFYPMAAGDQPRLILLDSSFCPILEMEGG